MATYYVVSSFAANLSDERVFDVVIMDEASQALLAMFAASNKSAKENYGWEIRLNLGLYYHLMITGSSLICLMILKKVLEL